MMDRNTLLLIAGRIMVFFAAVFLVLTLTYLTFFVVSDESRLLPRNPSISIQSIYDDLMIGEPRIDQYVNFMTRMISGEFFLSAGVGPSVSISDFVYDDIFATAGRLMIITVVVILAGFGYALLAAKCQGGIAGKVLRAVALVSAVLPPPLWYFGFIIIFREWSNDINTIQESSLYVSCLISLTAASAIVFERTARITHSSHETGLMRRTLRALSSSRNMAVLSFFMAFIFASIITIEWLGRIEGIGYLLFESLLNFDFPLMMVCVFVVSFMLLVMFLILDIVIILVSAPHSTSHPLADEWSRERAGNISWRTFSIKSISRVLAAFRKSRTGMTAVVAFILLMAISVLAPVLATVEDPYDFNWTTDVLLEPSLSPSPATGITHPLGTDTYGRDVYSMLLYDSLDAFLFVLILAAIALLLGLSMTLVIDYARRLDAMMARSIGWVLWITAEVFLCMILLLSSVTGSMLGASLALFAIIFVAWVYGPFARAESARMLQPSGDADDCEHSGRMGVAGAMSSSLHISKHVVLFGFLTAVMVEMLPRMRSWMMGAGGGDVIDIGWAHTIVDAYTDGGLISGWWWLFVPQAVMICLLGGVSYVILDRLEDVFERWHPPTKQPQPLPTAEESSASSPDGE